MTRPDGWVRREVVGDIDEIVSEVILCEPTGTYVVITEGEDPTTPAPKIAIIIPPWGEACQRTSKRYSE